MVSKAIQFHGLVRTVLLSVYEMAVINHDMCACVCQCTAKKINHASNPVFSPIADRDASETSVLCSIYCQDNKY